jgi:hypothetical protein
MTAMKRLCRIFPQILLRSVTATVNLNSEIVRPGFILLAALAMDGPVRAQSLEDLDKCEAAVLEAWQKAPLTVRNAVFVTEEPKAFGIYDPRPSARFQSGEKLILYLEPVGYGWKDVGNGQFEFGFRVDLLLKTAAGETVGSQDNFGTFALKSRHRNREFMAHLTLTLTDAPPGDYILSYKLHDLETDKTATVDEPFTLEK